jgi:hypothetical protein
MRDEPTGKWHNLSAEIVTKRILDLMEGMDVTVAADVAMRVLGSVLLNAGGDKEKIDKASIEYARIVTN